MKSLAPIRYVQADCSKPFRNIRLQQHLLLLLSSVIICTWHGVYKHFLLYNS